MQYLNYKKSPPIRDGVINLKHKQCLHKKDKLYQGYQILHERHIFCIISTSHESSKDHSNFIQ